MSSRGWAGNALKPIVVVITMTAIFLLAIVLLSAALPKRGQLTAAEVGSARIPPCIASRQQGGDPQPAKSAVRARAAFVAATRGCMTTMHAAMTLAFFAQPSADAVFAAAMVPHHQGGIDMARQLLVYGSDPEMRALALGVIAEQQAEIEMLRAWTARQSRSDSFSDAGDRQPARSPGDGSSR